MPILLRTDDLVVLSLFLFAQSLTHDPVGTTCDTVRSDLIHCKTRGGGAVFSVGSINWVGAMAWRHYQDDVARITANALHKIVRRPS